MKTKNTFNAFKESCRIQREEEIKKYGKQLSLRPSISHNSKKLYNRKKENKLWGV